MPVLRDHRRPHYQTHHCQPLGEKEGVREGVREGVVERELRVCSEKKKKKKYVQGWGYNYDSGWFGLCAREDE